MIDIRAKLHNVIGYLRCNQIIDAYELVSKMSKQEDDIYYGIDTAKFTEDLADVLQSVFLNYRSELFSGKEDDERNFFLRCAQAVNHRYLPKDKS